MLDYLLIGFIDSEYNKIYDTNLQQILKEAGKEAGKEAVDDIYLASNPYFDDLELSYMNLVENENAKAQLKLKEKRRAEIMHNIEKRSQMIRHVMSKYIFMDFKVNTDPFGNESELNSHHYIKTQRILMYRLNLQKVYFSNMYYYHQKDISQLKLYFDHELSQTNFRTNLQKHLTNIPLGIDYLYLLVQNKLNEFKENSYDLNNVTNSFYKDSRVASYSQEYSYIHLNDMYYTKYVPYIRKFWISEQNIDHLMKYVNVQALYYPFTFRPYWKNGVMLENNQLMKRNTKSNYTENRNLSNFYFEEYYFINDKSYNNLYFRNKQYSFNFFPDLYDFGLFPEYRVNYYSFDFDKKCSLKGEIYHSLEDQKMPEFYDGYLNAFQAFKDSKDKIRIQSASNKSDADAGSAAATIPAGESSKSDKVIVYYAPTFVGDVEEIGDGYQENTNDDWYNYSRNSSDIDHNTNYDIKVTPKYDLYYQARYTLYSKNITNNMNNMELVDPRIFDLKLPPHSKYSNKNTQYFDHELSTILEQQTNLEDLVSTAGYIAKYRSQLYYSASIYNVDYYGVLHNLYKTIDYENENLFKTNSNYIKYYNTIPYKCPYPVYYDQFLKSIYWCNTNTWIPEDYYSKYYLTQYNRKYDYIKLSMIKPTDKFITDQEILNYDNRIENNVISYTKIYKRYKLNYKTKYYSPKGNQIKEEKHKLYEETKSIIRGKLFENYNNFYNDETMYDYSVEDYMSYKFVAFEIKTGPEYVVRDFDGSLIQLDKADKYVINFDLYCNLQESVRSIYNSSCQIESIGEVIYSIVQIIRKSATPLVNIDWIKPLLNSKQKKVLNRLFNQYNENNIKETLLTKDGCLFSIENYTTDSCYCYSVERNTNDLNVETGSNTYFKYVNTVDKEWESMEHKIFDEPNPKRMFANSKCVREKWNFDWSYEKTVDGSMQTTPYPEKDLKLFYLAHVLAYEWFVVCGEGLFINKLQKDCQTSPYCKQCNVANVFKIWTALTNIKCSTGTLMQRIYFNPYFDIEFTDQYINSFYQQIYSQFSNTNDKAIKEIINYPDMPYYPTFKSGYKTHSDYTLYYKNLFKMIVNRNNDYEYKIQQQK